MSNFHLFYKVRICENTNLICAFFALTKNQFWLQYFFAINTNYILKHFIPCLVEIYLCLKACFFLRELKGVKIKLCGIYYFKFWSNECKFHLNAFKKRLIIQTSFDLISHILFHWLRRA